MYRQKKPVPTSQPTKAIKIDSTNWINIFILLGYGFITIITPDFKAFDANGPKFLALSILKLIILLFLIYKEYKNTTSGTFIIFLKTKIGVFYSLLLLISLISFVKSINITESIIHFTKVFTIFTAAWIISDIVRKDKSALTYLVVGMTGLLIYDSVRVFFEINHFIKGELVDIILIKGGYSNKNVLAASLLIKIPFALWLITFREVWLKRIGVLSIFFGVLAILFLSTRSMYLGLIFLSLSYVVFLVIRYFQTKEKGHLKNISTYLVSLTLGIVIYSLVQTFLYPKIESLYNQGVADRLSTIQAEAGDSERLKSWILTADLIKKNPLLGVGLGNWKVSILEKENPTRNDFTYHFKTHNDFLEIIAETGIIGGLCFIAIIFFVFNSLLNHLRGKNTIERSDLLFLSTFGLIAYSFDAFFNFPQDRPEIQSLFAIYLGIGIAVSTLWYRKKDQDSKEVYFVNNLKIEKTITKLLMAFILLVTIFSTYILTSNLKSLKIQRIFKEDELSGNRKLTSSFLIENFPSIPNLAATGDPINSLIAKKLIDEKKYEEVFKILNKNNSPFDTRREFYLSLAYLNINKLDSSEYYIDYAHKLKPGYYIYSKQYANILEKSGKNKEAIAILDNFLSQNKGEKEAWQYNMALNNKIGNRDKVMQLVDSAYSYFPTDTAIVKLKEYYTYNYYIPNYQEAIKNYNEGNFKEAARLFEMSESDFEKHGNPTQLPVFLNSWAHSLLEINNIQQAKIIFERVSLLNPKDYFSLKNLGYIALQIEKNNTKAIDYYTKSLDADSPDLLQSFLNLGTIYLIQNQKDLAISNYENALKYGTSEIALRNLALLWQEKGDQEKFQYYKSLILKE